MITLRVSVIFFARILQKRKKIGISNYLIIKQN